MIRRLTSGGKISAPLIWYKYLFRAVTTLQSETGFVIFFFILLSYYFLPGRGLRPGLFLFDGNRKGCQKTIENKEVVTQADMRRRL